MIWKGPDRFLLVGLDESIRIERSFLRFKTAEDASRAASAIIQIGPIIEELLPPVEEIRVQVRFLYTLDELFVLGYVFSIRLLIIGFIGFTVLSVLAGPFVPPILIGLYVVVYVLALVEKRRRRTGAWLRFEGKSCAVRTGSDWRAMVPREIEWKSAESFVLKGSGTKVEVTLPTGHEATQAVQRIKTTFPEIKEASLETRDGHVSIG